MAVVQVKPLLSTLTSRTLEVDEIKVQYLVETNSLEDGVLTVLASPLVPQPGDGYVFFAESYPGCRCKKTSLERSDVTEGIKYILSADFSTEVEDDGNPFTKPPEISWGRAQFQRLCERDINGNPILNTAGFYFDPPVEIDDSRPTLTIQRNEAAYDPGYAEQYQDAVNTDTWRGGSPGQWKIAGITASRKKWKEVFYWEVNYEFHFRREGWTKKILNQGRFKRAGTGSGPTSIKPILSADGQEVTEPVPLNQAGTDIAGDPGAAVFLDFTVYKQAAFSGLGLG